MRTSLVIAGLALVLSACGGAPKSVDWTALASEARPTFEQGKCGAQLKWTRDIEITEDVEIVGELTIRPKCPEQ